MKNSKIVLCSLDGNAYWFMLEVLKRELAKKYDNCFEEKEGGFLKLIDKYGLKLPRPLIVNFPSITCCGHAAIYNGKFSNENGVGSEQVFKLPHCDNNLLETFSGFSGNALISKPIWIETALKNIPTTVAQATQQFPLQVDNDREKELVNAYLTMTDCLGTYSYPKLINYSDLLLGDDDKLYYRIADTRIYFEETSESRINFSSTHPDQSSSMEKGFGKNYDFYAIDTEQVISGYLTWWKGSLEEEDIVFYMSQTGYRHANKTQILEDELNIPPCVTSGAENLFEAGEFGTPISAGGNGEAEQLYLETIFASIQSWENYYIWFRHKYGGQPLELYYLPYPDELLHDWGGFLLKDSPFYRPDWHELYWSFFDKLMDRIALFLEKVFFDNPNFNMENFLLVSDHGMDYAEQYFYINTVLEQGGFLKWKNKYEVDLSKTKIFLPKGGGQFLKVNLDSYKDGIVQANNVPKLLEKVTSYLLSVRDPKDNEFLVRNVWSEETWDSLGTGGVRGGELYLNPKRGTVLSHYSTDGEITSPKSIESNGDHGFWPLRPEMLASLMYYGNVSQKLPNDNIKQIDIVPLIWKTLK